MCFVLQYKKYKSMKSVAAHVFSHILISEAAKNFSQLTVNLGL